MLPTYHRCRNWRWKRHVTQYFGRGTGNILSSIFSQCFCTSKWRVGSC